MKKVTILLVLGASVMMADGARMYGAKCAECHGGDGKESAISGKAIAGSTGVLGKLIGYKNGTFGGEQKGTMQASVADMSDNDLKAVAAYVEKLK